MQYRIFMRDENDLCWEMTEGAGSFDSEDEAREFARAECGMAYLIGYVPPGICCICGQPAIVNAVLDKWPLCEDHRGLYHGGKIHHPDFCDVEPDPRREIDARLSHEFKQIIGRYPAMAEVVRSLFMADYSGRHCVVVSASVEDVRGGGDGAYDLIGVKGTPKELGEAIGNALQQTDLDSAGMSVIEQTDGELYLTVRIKVARHEVAYDE